MNSNSNGSPPTYVISDEEITELFLDPIAHSNYAPSKPLTQPAVSDYDYYWKGRGECPKCKNGINIQCLRGTFSCKKCGWSV